MRTSIAFSTVRSSARDRCSTATPVSKCFRRCRRRCRGGGLRARAGARAKRAAHVVAGVPAALARDARRKRELARALGARRRSGGVLMAIAFAIIHDMPAPPDRASAPAAVDPRLEIQSALTRIIRELIPGASGVPGRGRTAARCGARRLCDERRARAREARATQSARAGGDDRRCARIGASRSDRHAGSRRTGLHQRDAQGAARQRIVAAVLSDDGPLSARSDARAGERVIVEFVSANPTGPLHVGHGRQAALGDAIATLLEWQGCDVTREFYYNDAGQQIHNLAVSVRARAHEILGESGDVSRGRLSRRVHPRARAALSRRSGTRSVRHRDDSPLRRRRAAQGAGSRPAGVRRAFRPLLPRKLAVCRRPC